MRYLKVHFRVDYQKCNRKLEHWSPFEDNCEVLNLLSANKMADWLYREWMDGGEERNLLYSANQIPTNFGLIRIDSLQPATAPVSAA